MATKLTSDQEKQMELGKELQQFYNLGYVNKKSAIVFSFYKGIASGFGAVVGGSILIALLVWILGHFSQVPLAGHFVDSLRQTINSKSK